MQLIPSDIWEKYSDVLKKLVVPAPYHADYRKWLLYYLNFSGNIRLRLQNGNRYVCSSKNCMSRKQTPTPQYPEKF